MVEPLLLHGRYRVEDQIATGGMGSVYSATDERLGRRVAVKLLKPDLAADAHFVERFRREARAAAALSHPNIAGVFDYGEEEGHHFIVMEFVDGPDLAQLLRQEGPMSPERAQQVGVQTAEALAHAHAAGVVHRDIKPANVMLDGDGRVKVTDFGIARAAGDSTMTGTGSMLGTANYISPEQAQGRKIGPASDVYSLGIVLYEMLTGSVPFTADSPIGVAMRHISDPVPAPSELNPEVPASLDRIVARATAKRPEDRFRDAKEMGAALSGDPSVSGERTMPLGAAVPAAAAGTTAVLHTGSETEAWTDPSQTVWPIPGDRWDPARVGRAVIAGLAALAVLAIAVLVFKIVTAPEPDARTEPRARNTGSGAATTPATTGPEMPAVVGDNVKDAEDRLKDMDLDLEIEKSEAFTEDYEKDIVFDSDPPAGDGLSQGDTVTLFVSQG
ncbi:MAG: Stk1 family PASTA domain-containing Ser/Thr kinase, partial [Actinomycetota bacterium]|nr:Stk1 family PASTA domain-containing Ser/Thr kinase [Actinomycetota bacterium]